MATYQSEAQKIARRRAIAEALRASGNEALPASIDSGRIHAPVSGWQHANKALSTLLGAYEGRQADKAQTKLDAQDQQVLADLIAAKRESEAPDVNGEIDPNLLSDEGPTRVPAASKPMSKAERMQKLQAATLRGQQFGGSSTGLSGELLERELLPKVKEDFTLRENEMRVDGQTQQPIAVGMPEQPRESSEDRQLINVADPSKKSGFRTIKRSDWKGEQLYERPSAGAAIGVQLQGSALDNAAELYRQTGKLPSGLGRSPQATLKIIERAAQMSAELGDDAKAAALRQQYNKAGQSALMQLTKQQVAVGNYEKTAMNSLDIAQKLSAKVDRAGVPVLDRWIQAGKKNILGDVDVAKFHTANETFVTEYAKIMSGSMGNTPVSDATRQHARELITTAMTKEQYDGVIETLKQEMAGRIASFPAQMAELHSQLGASGAMPGQAPAHAAPPANGDDYSGLWNQ